MKRFKGIQQSIERLFLFKKVWLLGSLYSLFVLYLLTMMTRGAGSTDRGFFGLIADVGGLEGSTNQFMFITVGIPLIVIVLTQYIESIEKGACLVKIGSRFHLWHRHVIVVICLSFVLTCLILIIAFLWAGCFAGFNNTWVSRTGLISHELHDEVRFRGVVSHVVTYKVILIVFISKFLGLLTIAFFTLFLKQWLKNSALVLIILIALAGLDQTGVVPISFFTRAMTLSLQDWLYPMMAFYQCLYLFILSLVLYGVTGLLYERKDFI
ncbi:hypothetical protein GCM10011391_34990 [Pullulanibacillus camelliae]|uniref:Uncharacterized protein n=1 Tax=Pullulanibacillus camelliae TaxID=1707096 RepID=A0A8J2YM40_9BACL|nr:hypothetical protein [Pullulanibacillus camelliae]GGE53125.1 hypothetical protein GCM10011391_34990 [Pullulanibacillus camelliae]